MSRTLSFLEAAQKNEDFNPPRWRNSIDSIAPTRSWDWANAAYLLSHLIGEFLLQNETLIPTRTDKSGDDTVLTWLIGSLRDERTRGKVRQRDKFIDMDGIRICAYNSQRKMWILAAAAYILLVAGSQSIYDAAMGKGNSDDKQARGTRELREIQIWWEEKMRSWGDSGKIPDSTLTDDVLDHVAWLTSQEGEVVIDQLLWYKRQDTM